jgi:hypothetical protein
MSRRNIKNIKIAAVFSNVKLKKNGIKSVNSKSYSTRNTHNNVKLRLNCISVSVETLKPHS